MPGSVRRHTAGMDPERRPDLRVGDREREVTLERLRDAHAEGRLDFDEFYARLDDVYRARTYADLDALVIDLPPAGLTQPTLVERTVAAASTRNQRLPAARAPTGAGVLAAMPPALRRVWLAWATAVMINLIVWTAVSLGTQDLEYFWPIWVAGPWGVVNLGLTANWWFGRAEQPRQIGSGS